MKGPGFPGFRKAKPNAFYKSKPFEGDGRPAVSPFQHEKDNHHLSPHDDGDSYHAQQTRRNAELSKSDYTTDQDVSLDQRFPDDLDGDGNISQYEALKASNRQIDVKVRDEFTLSQQNNMISNARRMHKKSFRNHLKGHRNEEGQLPPGMKENGQGGVSVTDQKVFDEYFNNKWETELDENSLGYAYPNVYGQVTHYTDKTPNIDIAEIQLTNDEAIQYEIGGALQHAPKDAYGNVKAPNTWTEKESKKYEDGIMRIRQEMADNIKKFDPTADLKNDIRIGICERLTPEFIGKHGAKEEMTPEIMKEKNLVEHGDKIYYAREDGSPDIGGGQYVPPNAWSSNHWGKKMADELGLDPESQEYWNIANPKTRNEAKADGGYSTEVVAGTKDDVVGGGAGHVSTYNQGAFSDNHKKHDVRNATEGIQHISFNPQFGNSYNYRDKEGKLHEGLSRNDMLEIKTGMNADQREQKAMADELIRIEEQEKTRQQKLQEERENITSNFINSMPDEDQFFSGINEQENPKEWKKATDKYNKEYSSWHNKAVDANVDFDQVNDVLYPET